jgi:hypothetical protein
MTLQTRFGPEDEDAFIAARAELIAAYAGSPDAPPDGDTFIASMMLTYKWADGDGWILTWTWLDLEGLLLHYFPRKVTLDTDEIRTVTPDAAAFLGFLDRRGLLTGDPLPRLRAKLEELAPAFRAAMGDTSRFGLAKRMVGQMHADGVDVSEADTVEAWVDGFNARSTDERGGILDSWEQGPGPLPAVELPSDDELVDAARESPTLARLVAFTRAVERPRRLTKMGHLTLHDGKEIATALGIEDEFDPVAGSRVFRTRSTDDMPRLSRAFRWARAAGFVKVRLGWVSATQRGRKLGVKPHEDWLAAYRAFVDGEVPHGARREFIWEEEVQGELLDALPEWLYRTGGLEVTLVHDVARELLEDRFVLPEPGSWNDPRKWIGGSFDWRVLDPLVELGAAIVADGLMSLTPLGRWGTNRWLRARGVPAPILGELTGSTASELLLACAHMPLDDAEQEIRRWIAARPETAARQLADAARPGETAMLALYALGFAGPSAEPVVRGMLDVPELRPAALLWLVGQSYESSASLPPELLQVLFIETLAVLVDREDPDGMVEHIGSLGPEDAQIRFVEGLLRADHARTTEVLLAIGRLHPSKTVAKAARTMAFRRQGIRPH